jgi:3-polyprenyl-4-hydroxybenzoate decarboxylase
MARDLRTFLQVLRERGQLRTIDTLIDNKQ